MRHALAVLLTLMLGVFAHPASAAARVRATGPYTDVDADRGRLGVDDVRRESLMRRAGVALSDDRAEEPEDPDPSLAPAHLAMPTQRCATSVAPVDDGASRIAWRMCSGSPRGPPA